MKWVDFAFRAFLTLLFIVLAIKCCGGDPNEVFHETGSSLRSGFKGLKGGSGSDYGPGLK